MGYSFDSIIKEALNQEVNEHIDSKDIFQNIKQEVQKDKKTSNRLRNHLLISYNKRKLILATFGCILITFVLLFTFSSNIRSLAANAIETIFVLDYVDKEVKIVEKPMDEAEFFYCCVNRTFLSQKELEQKLGYSVHFPETLFDGYKLEYTDLGISMGKRIKQKVYREQDIKKIMGNALEDDSALEKLKEYSAYRNISASYKKQNGSRISVYVEPSLAINKIDEIIKYYSVDNVKINNLNGIWIKYKYPEYDTKVKNDKIITDRLTPPVKIIDINSLWWETENLCYHIETFKDHISIEKAIKIAESFQTEQ